MIISHKWKFIFIHIHKTPGGALVDAPTDHLGNRDIMRSTPEEWQARRLQLRTWDGYTRLAKDSTSEPAQAMIRPEVWSSYYKFAFVRHPVDRAVSLYRYGLTIGRSRRKRTARNLVLSTPFGQRLDPLHWPAVAAATAAGSFSEFLCNPCLESEQAMWPQWVHVYDRDGSQLLVDYIGRYEHLSTDLAVICAELGMPRVALRPTNVSTAVASHDVIVTSGDRRLLAQRFAQDFQRFGYDIERSACRGPR